MLYKDERLKLTNEILNGIRVIKLYAWEKAMMEKIGELRSHEIYLIRKSQLTRSVIDVANASSPFIVAAVAFTLFTLNGGELTPQIAFVSISAFSQLRAPLFMIAELIGQSVQVIKSKLDGRRAISFSLWYPTKDSKAFSSLVKLTRMLFCTTMIFNVSRAL